MIKKLKIFQKKVLFPQNTLMDTLIAVFITSLISFPQNSKKAPFKVRWWQKDLYFPKKAVFVKMFLWTSRIQFWQTRRKFVDEGRKSFDRCRRKLQKKIFSFFLFRKVPTDTWNAIVQNLPKSFCQNAEN